MKIYAREILDMKEKRRKRRKKKTANWHVCVYLRAMVQGDKSSFQKSYKTYTKRIYQGIYFGSCLYVFFLLDVRVEKNKEKTFIIIVMDFLLFLFVSLYKNALTWERTERKKVQLLRTYKKS